MARQGSRARADGAPRNRLGAVTFVIVLVGAVLSVMPAMAPLGMLLCLGGIVPAIVAHRRARRGTATNPRRARASLVMAPVFLLVAFVVVGMTAPRPAVTPAGDAGALAAAAPAAVAAPVAAPVVVPTTEATAPATSPEIPATAAVTPAARPQTVADPVVAPPPTSPRTTAPKVTSPRTTVPKVAAVAAPKTVAPKPAAPAAAACEEATHYVNSSGTCVLRPVAGPVAPAGATAQCSDGTYSSSAHRQGTCSRHGGVARWL